MAEININKIKYISKHINIIDKENKIYICKLLLTYNVILYQNNNGVYCKFNDINELLIDIIYKHLLKLFER